MVWAIVVVAIGVLGFAAWAGTGRLGEMPGAVTDRPKAHIPEGPVDGAFLEALVLPIAGTGYSRSQVDAVLEARAAGEDPDPGTRFRVVPGGYDMQAVDAVIERFDVDAVMKRSPVVDESDELVVSEGALESAEGAQLVVGIPKEGTLSATVPASGNLAETHAEDTDSSDFATRPTSADRARLREDEDDAG